MPTDYVRRHFRFGWWSLFVFASLGLLLEAFHGFKVGAYLDVSNETRRLMWRLAHVHGTLVAVVNILFALTLKGAGDGEGKSTPTISQMLIGAGIILPVGFFLGGVNFYSGDPGLGVLLVPVGAILLLAALYLIASSVASGGTPTKSSRSKEGAKDR